MNLPTYDVPTQDAPGRAQVIIRHHHNRLVVAMSRSIYTVLGVASGYPICLVLFQIRPHNWWLPLIAAVAVTAAVTPLLTYIYISLEYKYATRKGWVLSTSDQMIRVMAELARAELYARQGRERKTQLRQHVHEQQLLDPLLRQLVTSGDTAWFESILTGIREGMWPQNKESA